MTTNRHVPIITGVVAIAIGLAIGLADFGWWKYVVGAVFLWFGWAALKTGFSASDQEIEELTNSDIPMSEDTTRRFKDRL